MKRLQRVEVDGMRIGYRRTGSGQPLVLVHGAVCDSRAWRVQAGALGDEFDVVAWDAPGCGGSGDPPGNWRMADFADLLAGFIRVLGLTRPHVLGHSWGSAAVIALASRHPATVRSLTLVGAYAGWGGSLPAEEVERRVAFAMDVADAVETGGWDPRSMFGLFSDALPPQAAKEQARIMADIRPAGTRVMALALAADLRDALPSIAAPALVLHGERDERSPLGAAEAIHAAIPGSTLVVIPGAGHLCADEDPVTFDREVRAFLRAH